MRNRRRAFSSIFRRFGSSGGAVVPPAGEVLSLTLTETPNQIAVDWDDTADTAGYLLVRRAGAAVDFSPTNGVEYTAPTTSGDNEIIYVNTTSSYTDTGLDNFTTYHYKIWSFNSAFAYTAGATANETPLWYPTDLSTALEVLFDISDTDTITKNGSNQVSQVDDLSGNTRHATQAGTDSIKPVWVDNQLNGKACLRFTATGSQRMAYGTDDLAQAGTATTVFAVVKSTAVGGTYYHVMYSVKTPDTNRNLIGLFSNDAVTAYSVFTMNIVGTPTGPAGVRIASGDYTTSPQSMIVHYNGGTTTNTSSWEHYRAGSSLTISTAAAGNGSGQNNWLGAINATPALFFNGDLYCYGIVNRALTAGERANLVAWIDYNWGV